MLKTSIIFVSGCALIFFGCQNNENDCIAGEVQSCPCLDAPDGVQTCAEDGKSFEPCQCGTGFGDGNVLEGSYTIANSQDLEKIRSFKEITGNLTVSAAGLSALKLPNLTTIGGDLIVDKSDDLTSLEGLSNLTRIGGNFHLIKNASLEEVVGLENLESIGGNIYFHANTSLRSIDGLSNLKELKGNLWVFNNPAIVSLEGFTGLTEVGGHLYTWNNDSLRNLDGYRNIQKIGGGLCFSADDLLEDVTGLSGIKHVHSDLHVFLASSLKSLEGLHNIHTVEGTVYIGFQKQNVPMHNAALENLDGLAGLAKVGKDLAIVFNESLLDIEGLANLQEVGEGIAIYDNPLLPSCQAQSLVDRLEQTGWDGLLLLDLNKDDECDG
ncbi:MAG: hypothetical protein GY854_18320 [Deltaproteobacteria bacterium]|nr:hypothetical protein [Deltaproteobacteria bacterium]